LPIHAEQTSIGNLISTHSKVGDSILSRCQSSANLMIAGVQELHGSTFDATVMQTDPSEGRNQLRSDRVLAYRNSTLDQRYLSEDPTNQHQTVQESLQDPSTTGGQGGDTNIDEFEVDDNFGDKLQWAEQRAVSLKLPLRNIDTVRESNPRPVLHASEPLTARLTNMITTSGNNYDSPKRQSETGDHFKFSLCRTIRQQSSRSLLELITTSRMLLTF
jgi:hypothetical protein